MTTQSPVSALRLYPPRAAPPAAEGLDVNLVRAHFAFAETPRIVTNNAASTQSPRELVSLLQTLVPEYENVHRGQSAASRRMSALLDDAYATLAQFVNAPSPRSIVFCRNTTEAINTVMYSLMGELRSGDNVVTTLMEHNSNYVPWYGL